MKLLLSMFYSDGIRGRFDGLKGLLGGIGGGIGWWYIVFMFGGMFVKVGNWVFCKLGIEVLNLLWFLCVLGLVEFMLYCKNCWKKLVFGSFKVRFDGIFCEELCIWSGIWVLFL